MEGGKEGESGREAGREIIEMKGRTSREVVGASGRGKSGKSVER